VRLLIAWSPENLPAGTERAVEKVRGVEATTVLLGIDWLTATRLGGGVVRRPPSGYAYPIEFAYVEHDYGDYVPDRAARAIRALERGEAVISHAEKELRGGGAGTRLRFSGRAVHVTNVITNDAAQGYEALAPRPVPNAVRTMRSVLIRKPTDVSKARIREAILSVLPAGRNLKIASGQQVEFLRHASGIPPLSTFKRVFDEFPARETSGVQLDMEPGWRSAHIKTDAVPILGNVTCHRRLFRQLRGALTEVRDRGLAHLIDPGDYAGCYYPRYVSAAVGARISRHTWGIALDINASRNPYGSTPTQDRRLVRIMRKWGFAWGGTWPTPDGMHFEWERRPAS
jgi:D-alanyl-D-alanine carboxypeptidase